MVRSRLPLVRCGTAVVLLVGVLTTSSSRADSSSGTTPAGIAQCISTHLQAVSFSDPDNGWAVGYRLGGNIPAAVHWDGARWKPAVLPRVPNEGYLYDVAVFSQQQAWAVGTYNNSTRTGFRTLIFSWDGERWTKVPSPNPDVRENELYGVTVVSADDAWAVGAFGRDTSTTLVLHWDGDRWTRVAAPNPDHDSYLAAVSAASADDVWAAGTGFLKGVVLHWDGASWSRVKIPVAEESLLTGVTTDAQGDAWVVGFSFENWQPYERTMTVHWDGSRWERVASSNPSHRYNELYDVDGAGPDDVWAVGGYLSGKASRAITQHWDGTSWTTVPVSQPPDRNVLNSVAALSPDNAWAVGEHDPKGSGSQRCLIEHWDGTSWTRQR
jgi:hypothetical protein